MDGNCVKAADAIDDFGEGDLGRLRVLLLEHHAKRCGRCASYLKRMEAVVDGLAGLGRVYAPEDLADSVLASLYSNDECIEERGAIKKSDRRNLVLVVGAAGVGVGVAVALAIVRWVVGRERDEALAPAGPA